MPLRSRAPAVVRITGRRVGIAVGQATAPMRARPDFVLAGAQRAGTTSLFRALMQHPQVVRPSMHKGVNYFDVNYTKGSRWYAAHFPLRLTAALRTSRVGGPSVFEASGYYLYHPVAAERLASDVPGVKVVVMLRDPVERAFSAYKHEVARGFEDETFERAIDLEFARIAGEEDRMRADSSYTSFAHRHQSYLHRGHYADQIERLLRHVPRERVHLIESEQFFTDPTVVFGGLVTFLGLSAHTPRHFDQYNARAGGMDAATRSRLRNYFRPYDERLVPLLGRAPGWVDRDGE